MPEGEAQLHPLAAYKGVELSVADRPLVAELVDRLRASGGFGPISIAGPASIHARLELDADLIDTDSSVAENLRAALRHHAEREHRQVAIMACDVLPTAEELRDLAALHAAGGPCACWIPLVRRPEDDSRLGSFAWKPRYDLQVRGEAQPIHVLPGHLTVLEPAALQLDLVLGVMDVAYTTRNTPVGPRSRRMALGVLSLLLRADLARLARGRPPALTWRVLGCGFWLARALRSGKVSLEQAELRLARAFLTDDRRGDAGTARGLRSPIVDVLSLAEDVDTQEEADFLHLGHP
ncbi:hypothetical protein [Engelhardtia mirabilis]|uniref:Uncharacterized protein n=1 Tax=Engelhardtia mirabilis TaxID=2528011 RepID=A0A518BEL3_9BACT|nr:hypothetical protein Pla133_04860 [Planctomycetes bacterium Pla133]QDU99747.1 hypothetical protein Pla86_04860 [Planctomycetes bacterium Pla86]